MKSPSWKMAMNSPPTAPFEPGKKKAISGVKDRKRLPLRHPKSQVGGRRTELQGDGRDYHGILRYILTARGCCWGTGDSREELRCEAHSNISCHPLLTASCSKLRPKLNRRGISRRGEVVCTDANITHRRPIWRGERAERSTTQVGGSRQGTLMCC